MLANKNKTLEKILNEPIQSKLLILAITSERFELEPSLFLFSNFLKGVSAFE